MMSRTTVRRIESINQASREIISGDLSRRIPTRRTGDDFDVLSDNLNAMLDRIGLLMEDVRRVSDNIAHDLRTPLARLRNRLEELHLQTAGSGQYSEGIEQAVAEADRLLSTFNALLRIARIESQHGDESFAVIAMGDLVRDVAELYEPLMEEKNQSLAMQLPGDVQMSGDRDLLFQAIANLMDNATKYTPAAGSIRIDLVRLNGKGRLVIADSGPGIPEAAREKVFQRFFRLEQSRTTPGNGLGMSLVAAVVTSPSIESAEGAVEHAIFAEAGRGGVRVSGLAGKFVMNQGYSPEPDRVSRCLIQPPIPATPTRTEDGYSNRNTATEPTGQYRPGSL
jgi:signal transduction histidine kinase